MLQGAWDWEFGTGHVSVSRFSAGYSKAVLLDCLGRKGEARGITAPRCDGNRLDWAWSRSGQGIRYKRVPDSSTRSSSTQQQHATPARKPRTMAATAIHHTFSIRPAHSAPEFIPFDPSRLAVKPPRTHHRKRKPNIDPSPYIPWVDIDEIVRKDVDDNVPNLDLTGPEPGSQSPEYRLLPATTRDIDRIQIDTIGRSGFTQREDDGNRSRSPITLDTREDGYSTPLKGSSLDEPFVIEDNGSDDESECENELPSRTSLFEREVGLNSERGPLQADNSAQSAPEATLPDPRAEDIGESNGDDNLFLGLTDAELDGGQLRQNFEADERIISSQAHDSAMQSDQAATTAGHDCG